MATIKTMPKKHLHKVTLCDMWTAGYQTRSLFCSDRKTIEPGPQAHKPADSGAVVGNDARMCSLSECLEMYFKHRRLFLTQVPRMKARTGK